MKAALPRAGPSRPRRRALLWLKMLRDGRMRLGTLGTWLVLVHASAACEFGPFPYSVTGIVCRMTKPAALLRKYLLPRVASPRSSEKVPIDQPGQGGSSSQLSGPRFVLRDVRAPAWECGCPHRHSCSKRGSRALPIPAPQPGVLAALLAGGCCDGGANAAGVLASLRSCALGSACRREEMVSWLLGGSS